MAKNAKKKTGRKKKPAKEKAFSRRPDGEFTQSEIRQIGKMAGNGLTVEQMAEVMRCSKRTFERRIKRTEGGQAELAYGRSKALDQVAGKLFKKAKSGVAWAVCFYLKTKGGFKETQKIEHTGNDGDAIKIEDDREKRRAEIARLQGKLNADSGRRAKA